MFACTHEPSYTPCAAYKPYRIPTSPAPLCSTLTCSVASCLLPHQVTPEERERAEMLFAADQRTGPVYVQDSRPTAAGAAGLPPQGQQAGRVPVRLTAVSFESLTGYGRPAAADTGVGAPSHPQPAGGSAGLSMLGLGVQGSIANMGIGNSASNGAGGPDGGGSMLAPLGRAVQAAPRMPGTSHRINGPPRSFGRPSPRYGRR